MFESLKTWRGGLLATIFAVVAAMLWTACEGSPLALAHLVALTLTCAMFWATLHMDKVRR